MFAGSRHFVDEWIIEWSYSSAFPYWESGILLKLYVRTKQYNHYMRKNIIIMNYVWTKNNNNEKIVTENMKLGPESGKLKWANKSREVDAATLVTQPGVEFFLYGGGGEQSDHWPVGLSDPYSIFDDRVRTPSEASCKLASHALRVATSTVMFMRWSHRSSVD
jgi:hypothetical protein